MIKKTMSAILYIALLMILQSKSPSLGFFIIHHQMKCQLL